MVYGTNLVQLDIVPDFGGWVVLILDTLLNFSSLTHLPTFYITLIVQIIAKISLFLLFRPIFYR